jgi:hypothetical protein
MDTGRWFILESNMRLCRGFSPDRPEIAIGPKMRELHRRNLEEQPHMHRRMALKPVTIMDVHIAQLGGL